MSLIRKYTLILALILAVTVVSVRLFDISVRRLPQSPPLMGTAAVGRDLQRVALERAPATLDPVLASSYEERLLCSLLYDTLYVWDGRGDAAPGRLILQETRDARTLRIELDPQVLFHSGRRVAAEDVKASLERALRMSAAAGLGWEELFLSVEGVGAFLAGRSETVSGIRILGPAELEIRLLEEDPGFPRALSLPQTAILEARTLQRERTYGRSFRNALEPSINGTGRAQVAAWDDRTLVLEPHRRREDTDMVERLEIVYGKTQPQLLLEMEEGRLDGALLETDASGLIGSTFPDLGGVQEEIRTGLMTVLILGETLEGEAREVLCRVLQEPRFPAGIQGAELPPMVRLGTAPGCLDPGVLEAVSRRWEEAGTQLESEPFSRPDARMAAFREGEIQGIVTSFLWQDHLPGAGAFPLYPAMSLARGRQGGVRLQPADGATGDLGPLAPGHCLLGYQTRFFLTGAERASLYLWEAMQAMPGPGTDR